MMFPNFRFASARLKQSMLLLAFGLLIVGICTIWLGCASENLNLVNPPSGLDSVYIRFVNFADDGDGRILSLDQTIQTNIIMQNTVSSVLHSPSDSAITTVIHNGTNEYRPVNKFRFSRSSFQTLVALPSISSASLKRPVDTLMPLYTPYIPASTKATVRMMNCGADSTKRYSLRLGCPNGTEIAFDNGFRTQSAIQELPGGRIGVTLIERSGDSSQAVDLFECTLADKSSYTFFVVKYAGDRPSLYLLNERTSDANAMTQLVAIPQRTASIRTVNLSKSSVDIDRITDNVSSSVISGVSAGTVSDYISVTACNSFAADSFSIESSGGGAIVSTTLEALKRYTLLSFGDTHTTPAIFVPEQSGNVPSGKVAVRVVNSLYNQTPITVSLGATTDATNPSGFSSGVILASNLVAGEYSLPAYITPGELPVTVFTSTSPARLLFGSVPSLSPDKKYLLVVSSGANDITTATLIEESQTSGSAEVLPRGSFAELVHAIGGRETITCGFDRVLSGSKLYFSNSIATILPIGNRTLTIDGIGSIPVNASTDSSLLAIVTGTSVADILLYSAPTGTILPNSSRRRYINASKDVPELTITQDSLNGSVITPNLAYRSAFEVAAPFEQRITLVFSKPSAKDSSLCRIENVSFPLGKNYSIIFIGSSGKYSAIIEQEF